MPADLLDPPAADAPAPPRVDGVAIPVGVWDAGATLFADDDAFRQWLRRPRPHFDGRTPLSLIQADESDAVRTLIVQLTHGVFP